VHQPLGSILRHLNSTFSDNLTPIPDGKPEPINGSDNKKPQSFPTGGFDGQPEKTAKFEIYISTVAACSTNAGIWSTFM